MYDDDYDEYTVSYDFRDYEYEKKSKLIPTELKSESNDFADGLREWVESMAGRAISDPDEGSDEGSVDTGKLWDEIQAEKDKILEEELKNPEYWKKVYQEADERSTQTPMYDFGLCQMSNERAMLDFYGLETVQRIWREISEANNLPDHVREVGQISTKLWQELKDIRAGRIPNPKSPSKKKIDRKRTADPSNSGEKNSESSTKPNKKESQKVEIIQRERQSGDDYYMRTERGVIRNRSYREFFQGRGIVYEWIWANLVRKGWIDKKGYPIRENYYDKGYLAYCSTLQKIADECGLAKNTAIKYLDEFKKAGIIKVEHLVPKGEKRGESVFILGEWKEVDGEPVECFYRDEIFLSEKPVNN